MRAGRRVVGGRRHRRRGSGGDSGRRAATVRAGRRRGGQRGDRRERAAAAGRPGRVRPGARGQPARQRAHRPDVPAAPGGRSGIPAADRLAGRDGTDADGERLLREQGRGGGVRPRAACRGGPPRGGGGRGVPVLDGHRHGPRHGRLAGTAAEPRPVAVPAQPHLPGRSVRRPAGRRDRAPLAPRVRPALGARAAVAARSDPVGHRPDGRRPCRGCRGAGPPRRPGLDDAGRSRRGGGLRREPAAPRPPATSRASRADHGRRVGLRARNQPFAHDQQPRGLTPAAATADRDARRARTPPAPRPGRRRGPPGVPPPCGGPAARPGCRRSARRRPGRRSDPGPGHR